MLFLNSSQRNGEVTHRGTFVMSGMYLVVNGYLAAFGCRSANLPYHFGDEHVLFHPDS